MATKDEPKPETYPVFRILRFPFPMADHVNWNSIAKLARDVGANFRAEWDQMGCVVTIEWPVVSDDTPF